MFKNLKFNFKNKNVLVVGGSRGIGEEIVKEFLIAGASVYYASRQKSKNISDAFHIKTDLKEEAQINSLFNNFNQNKKLDILINTAAINFSRSFDDIDYGEWKDVIETNLNSTFLVSKLAVNLMKKNSFGKIVNVSSIAGRSKSIASGAHYVSSKAGIIGLTRQIAFEVAKFNINVNVVCPSQTLTDMLRETMSQEEILKLEKNIPLKRVAFLEEQVGPIMFLCSDAASYITGACLDVNGGQL